METKMISVVEFRDDYKDETGKDYNYEVAKTPDPGFLTMPTWEYVCWLEGQLYAMRATMIKFAKELKSGAEQYLKDVGDEGFTITTT